MDVKEIGVKVAYRNRKMEETFSETYPLEQYTELFRDDLHKIISDVESLCYDANDGKSKEEWTDATYYGFNKIKHKLLDKAGEIGRLPENLVEIKTESLTNFVARILNEGE